MLPQQLQGDPNLIQHAAAPSHAEAPANEKFSPPSYGNSVGPDPRGIAPAQTPWAPQVQQNPNINPNMAPQNTGAYAAPPIMYQQNTGPQGVFVPMNPTMPMYAMNIPGQSYQEQLLARCRAGDHSPETKYGTVGIITAIVCFPIGLICLFGDSKRVCMRCKEVVM